MGFGWSGHGRYARDLNVACLTSVCGVSGLPKPQRLKLSSPGPGPRLSRAMKTIFVRVSRPSMHQFMYQLPVRQSVSVSISMGRGQPSRELEP